ncbi:unnamed protein product [Symbiodinium microadriaticum]|nr:unnamed protein product [Symbiodinium microadriaticum]
MALRHRQVLAAIVASVSVSPLCFLQGPTGLWGSSEARRSRSDRLLRRAEGDDAGPLSDFEDGSSAAVDSSAWWNDPDTASLVDKLQVEETTDALQKLRRQMTLEEQAFDQEIEDVIIAGKRALLKLRMQRAVEMPGMKTHMFKKIRKQIARAMTLRFSDLALLSGHHSRPHFREFRLVRMGRGGAKGQKYQAWGSDYDSAPTQGHGKYYKYWGGSWAVSPKSQNQPQQSSRYDAAASLTRRQAAPWREDVSLPPPETSVMVAVQKALTATRKADVKMRKLKEEKEFKKQAWQDFLDTKRKELATQKKNFDADLLRIDKDMEATAETGSQAASRVQELVLRGAVALQQPTEEEEPPGAEWDELIAEATAAEPGFFQTALLATRMAPGDRTEGLPRREPSSRGDAHARTYSTPDRTPTALPRTPLPSDILQRPAQEKHTGGHGVPVEAPPAAGTSPITPTVSKAMQKLSVADKHHPGQRDASKPRCKTSEEQPRPTIKEATMTTTAADTGGKLLADKLEQKREALRTGGAMTPFGIPLRGTEGQDTGQEKVDPLEVDLEMEHETKSPGFGGSAFLVVLQQRAMTILFCLLGTQNQPPCRLGELCLALIGRLRHAGRPLTRRDIEEFSFYIGAFAHFGPPRDFAVSDLFRSDSIWSQIQHAFCFDELRIPTPPIQEADYFAAISWQAEKRQVIIIFSSLKVHQSRIGPLVQFSDSEQVTHDSDEEMTDENAAPPSVTQHLDNDAPTRGFALERIALEIEIPSTVSVVTALLQQRRNQDIAIDFPGLVPANPQPDARWGLFLALPLWGPLLNTICVDIFATRQLLFAVPAPATADRDILCDLAGLPNGVDFDVYVDFYGPVAEQLTVDLCSGSTICFVPSGTQRPWSIQLSAMLETHLPWDDSAPFPDDGAFDRYCLACADGMRVFPMIPDRARLYREDIAARLQCPSRLLQLVPASPGPRDIAFFGLKCRNVIAALDRSNMRADDRTTVGLLDARRIYKGWLPLVSNEGWLDVCAVLEQVAVDLPLGWRARLEGLEDNQRHVYLEDGLVLVAVARPARDGITASTAAPPSGCIAQPLGQTDGHPSAAPAPSVSSSCAPGSIDGQLGTRGSPSANSSYDAVAGRCRKSAKIAVQPEMWILCLILQAIRDGSTGLTPSRLVCAVFCLAFSFFAQAIVHRARGTQATRCNLLFVLLIISLNAMPCEAMQWKRGDATPDWHSASGTHNFGSSVPFSVGPRPIPTPCRAPTIHHPHVHAEHVSASRQDEKQDTCQFASDGPTLLECSLYEMSGQPFWEAATLLETLHEHFAGHMIRPTAPRVSGQPSGTPIDLASSLPACQTHDLTPVVFRLGRTLDDVVPLFATKWTLPTVLPAEVRLHRSTRLALGDMISDPPHFPPSVFDLYTDGSFNGSVSGWSFVVIATWPQGSSVYGFARGLVHLPGDPLYLGAREHSAINGEKTALFWAHAWLLQKPSISAARIWADCLPALGQTQGEYQLGEGDLLARACRSIAQAAASAGQICQTAYAHVNSHCGEPFNELADVLAKAFQLAETPIPPAISKFVEWVERDDLPWLWLLVDAFLWPEAWPTHAYSLLADNKPTGRPNETDLRSCLVTTVDNTAPVLTGSESALRFQPKVLSINVQTLEENSDTGVEGRVPYIREQLEALQVCIAGLQETRARQSATFVSETHLRYLSQKDTSGNLGIELWLSRTIPFAWRHQQPLVFGQDDIRVVYTDPRTLIAKFTRDMLRFFIVVVHAPTAADSSRNTWWKSLHDRLVTLVKGVPVLLLGDFNTRCQHEITGRVGDLLCEAGQPVPPYLSKLFAVLDLWLPSTFSGIHSGASYTWMSPGHGSASRIDYIALPTRWRAKSEGSYVLHDVDFGQKGIDHFAIALQVDVWLYQRCKSHNGPRRIDTACMQHPDARGVLTNICQQTPDVPWAVDPHTHYSMLAEHWSSSLVRAFPCSQKRARRTYFSDGTWDLRQRRVELRRQLSRDSRSGLHTELAAAFESWNGQTTFLSTVARGVGECLRCLCQVKRDLQELRSLQPQLKRSIRADRRAYIAEIAKSARATTTKDVVQKLRPLLGLPKRRQKGPLALPLVELENGDFAQDAAEADQRWIRHFSAIEDGGPIQVEEHINACWKRQSDRDLESLDLHYADVPSLLDIERSLRASHCGKAIGNDGVPADLLHLQAANVAKAVFKVFFKTALRLQEPIAWKGGSLHAIWKGKGSQSDCANYRAILVSSATGKSIHGALREKCAPLMDRACTPLQIGGRKGQPVQVATHAVRAFQTACITRKKPCAVLFVDLREAFHRVVRPLIHGGSLDDHHVAGLIKELGLEPDTVHRLHAYVRESSLLAESGSTQWTAAIMHEVGEDAWFSFGKTGGFAHVRGGTRPGDNLADMVFTFLFSEVSKRIRDGFQQAGITSCLPWHETWLCGLPDGSVEPDDICSPVDATWMDDMSILLQANSSQELIERLRTAATTTLDECLQAVLLPNLRQGKTEAVVSFVGKGSLKTAKQAFEGSDPTLLLQSSIWPDARLRFAAVYKHLGGLIQVGGGLKLEFKARVGSAWQAFNKHKRLIFGSPVVTLQEKSILFTSLVESTLYYGAGTWSLVRPAEKDKLQGCLLQMARQMLRPRYSHEQATAELWAILHYEGHWLNEMQDTLEWFRRQHHHSNSLLPLWETWKGVVDYIRTSPNGWKRAVNKAKRTAILRELWQAECQQHHGLVFRALTKLGAVVPEDVVDHVNKRELCAKCGVVFDDLRAWSHHAFKRHGRVNPVRALAHGTQCAVCLKHFSTNKRLCNHLEYSRPCRHALINAGYSCQPAPGTGSRKFDDGHRCLQPATQAQGPERCWDFAEALDETHTPCAYVISRLEDCFYATDCHFPSRHHLLQHIKGLFQEHCLQQSRMRATVKAWQVILADALDADDDVSILWATWHSQVARYLEHVDFVEWLGEGCEGVDQAAAIYQQAEALLPWLEVPCQVFEKSQAAFAIGVCVNRWEPALVNFDNDHCVYLMHQQCKEAPRLICPTTWISQLRPGSCVFLSCDGLVDNLGPPLPLRSFKSIDGPLRSLRLFSDLLRCTLFLWERCVPACLYLPVIICPSAEAVRKAALFALPLQQGTIVSNFRLEGQAPFVSLLLI